MDQSKAIARILALIELANNNPNVNEASLARDKAEALLDKYQLTLAYCRNNTRDQDMPGSVEVTPSTGALWRSTLAWRVANYTGVDMVRTPARKATRHRGGRKSFFTLIGRPADIETWRALFTRAEEEIEAEAVRYLSTLPQGSRKSASDSFRKGAAQGFGQRLQEYAKECQPAVETPRTNQHDGAGSTALVMVGRDLAVKQKTKELFPRLRTQRSTVSRVDSYGKGVAYGRSMGVHKGSLR